MDTERMSCEDEGRDPGDGSTNEAMSDITRKPPWARRQAWKGFSLTSLWRNHSCPYLDLKILALRTGRQNLSWFKLPSLWYFDKAGPENSQSMCSSTPNFTEAKPQESYVMYPRPHSSPTAGIESTPRHSWLPSYHPRPHLCPCPSASAQQDEENQCNKSQKADALWTVSCFSINSNTEVIAVSKFIYSSFHLKQKMTARNVYFLISEWKQLF